MPTYTFYDECSEIEWEEFLTMAQRGKLLEENPQIKQLPPSQLNIVAGVGGIKNDDGWQENLDRIATSHPTSALAASRGSRHSTKEVKTRLAVEKWKRARAKDDV